jgi:TRAP-type C4-dicarboxylate transport system permease small subunit
MKIIEKIEKVVACLCVTVMAILVFANVITRFIFNYSMAVADEMSCYLFVLMSFMGTAIAARRRAHLGLTILTDHLSPKAARIVQTLMYAIATIFCLMIVIFGVQMVISQYQLGQQTSTMQWPEWIYGLFVPLGGAFSTVAFLDGTIKIAKGDK